MTGKRPATGQLAGQLSREAFADGGELFFSGADRGRLLADLRELATWPRPLLVITGPAQVGKSTLFRALSTRLDPNIKTARVNGALVRDAQAVLTAVAQSYGIPTGTKPSVQHLMDGLSAQVHAQRKIDRDCLVLIDDAQQLDPKALDVLLQLVRTLSSSGLYILLFAEPGLIPVLDKLSRPAGAASWHEIRLSPFTAAETRDYLSYRLTEAGWTQPLPFTEAEVVALAEDAQGLPGRLNVLASTELRQKVQATGRKKAASGWPPVWLHRALRTVQAQWLKLPPLPPLHRLLVAVVLVLLATLWVFWPATEQPPQRVALEIPAPSQSRPEPVPETVVVAPPAPPVSAEPPPVQSVITEPPAPPVAAPAPQPPAPPAQTQPSVQPVQPQPTQAQPTQAQPAPAVGARDRAWLLAQPPERFTLQLFGVTSASRVEEFLARQRNPQDFASYQVTRDGNPWHVVLYGNFPDRAAAEAASRRLPAGVGQVQPWIRTFGAIQNDLQRR